MIINGRRARLPFLAALVWLVLASPGWSQTRQTILIRGHEQNLYLYGSPQASPIIVSGGDGGWLHLGPHVAEFLASQGFFVVGFDVKAYLAGFTTVRSALRPEDVPADYRILAAFASRM